MNAFLAGHKVAFNGESCSFPIGVEIWEPTPVKV
jgi:hypothetical protein